MPSPADVRRFQGFIDALSGVSAEKAAALVVAHRDVDVLQQIYPEIITPYLAAAGRLSEEWYHNLAPEERFDVESAPLTSRGELAANARWAAKQLDPAAALSGTAQRQVHRASRRTIAHNARREGVRYARVANATACSWCRMLASRGAVYASEGTADASHDFCFCGAVANRRGNPYVMDDNAKRWKNDYDKAVTAEGMDTDAIVNHMRRQNYAENADFINAQQRQWYKERVTRKRDK